MCMGMTSLTIWFADGIPQRSAGGQSHHIGFRTACVLRFDTSDKPMKLGLFADLLHFVAERKLVTIEDILHKL